MADSRESRPRRGRAGFNPPGDPGRSRHRGCADLRRFDVCRQDRPGPTRRRSRRWVWPGRQTARRSGSRSRSAPPGLLAVSQRSGAASVPPAPRYETFLAYRNAKQSERHHPFVGCVTPTVLARRLCHRPVVGSYVTWSAIRSSPDLTIGEGRVLFGHEGSWYNSRTRCRPGRRLRWIQ